MLAVEALPQVRNRERPTGVRKAQRRIELEQRPHGFRRSRPPRRIRRRCERASPSPRREHPAERRQRQLATSATREPRARAKPSSFKVLASVRIEPKCAARGTKGLSWYPNTLETHVFCDVLGHRSGNQRQSRRTSFDRAVDELRRGRAVHVTDGDARARRRRDRNGAGAIVRAARGRGRRPGRDARHGRACACGRLVAPIERRRVRGIPAASGSRRGYARSPASTASRPSTTRHSTSILRRAACRSPRPRSNSRKPAGSCRH